MNKVPIIRPKLKRSSKKPAFLWAVGIALFIPAALGCVLAAISIWEFNFPLPQTLLVSFVSNESNNPQVEEMKSEATPSKVDPTEIVPPMEFITTQNPLVMELPPPVDLNTADFAALNQERLPNDAELGDFVIEKTIQHSNEKQVRLSKPSTKVSAPAEITPDKPVRYRYTPSLPKSVNVNRVGKVNDVVKVVVSVSTEGKPSDVQLIKSCGNAEADRLFMTWVKENWTFYPAEKDGHAIPSKVVVPVRLNID